MKKVLVSRFTAKVRSVGSSYNPSFGVTIPKSVVGAGLLKGKKYLFEVYEQVEKNE